MLTLSYLLRKHKRMLTVTLLLASLWSCKKESNVDAIAESDANNTVTANLTGNIIYQENADGATLFGSYVTIQTGISSNIAASTTHAYNGTKSARFILRDTDPENNNGTRSEISFPVQTNLNRWYAYAIYFPANGQYDSENADEVITQWHQGGGFTPSLCLRTRNDHIYLRVIEVPGGEDEWIDLGLIDHEDWTTYVMHVRHSSASDGLVEIWRNGSSTPIFTRNGPNMYAIGGDIKAPNWKLGIYKSGWNGSNTTATNLRVLYFDDIKLGNENATLSEMWPVP